MKKLWLITLILLLLCSCTDSAASPETTLPPVVSDDGAVTTDSEPIVEWRMNDYIGSGKYVTYQEVKDKYPDKTVLRWQVCMGTADTPTDLVNEYLDSLGKDYAVCFEPMSPSFASGKDYLDSVKELINSGNQPDIINTWVLSSDAAYDVSSYSAFVKAGIMADISELLADTDCGKSLYDIMPSAYWDSLKIDGGIYGVDGYMSCIFPARYVIYNKELVDKYGFDTQKPIFSQQEEVLDIVEKEGCNGVLLSGYDVSMVHSLSRGSAYSATYFDEAESCFKGVLENSDYVDLLEVLYAMTKNGSSAHSFTVGQDAQMSAKPYLAYVMSSVGSFDDSTYYGLDNKPFEALAVELFPVTITNANSATGICEASENKEQAFELLCLTQTDKYLCELLAYGPEESRIYTGDNVELASRLFEFMRFGNSMLCTPYRNMGFVISKDSIENAFTNGIIDPVIGFTLDVSPIQDEFRCCQKIVLEDYGLNMDDYMRSADSFDEFLSDYRDKLEKAGLSAVIDESNRQYNEWRDKQ